MIRGFFYSLICTCFLLTAGARKPFPLLPFPTSVLNLLGPHSAYSSELENVPAWQFSGGKGTLLATFSRQLPQISSLELQDGIVLVFAKGYDFGGGSKGEEKPVGLPFYMASANETTPQFNACSYYVEEGKVNLVLSMHEGLESGFKTANQDIRLRYFVLPPEFLQQHRLSTMAIRKMPYTQLIGLLGTTP
jgi:hypothetical protein